MFIIEFRTARSLHMHINCNFHQIVTNLTTEEWKTSIHLHIREKVLIKISIFYGRYLDRYKGIND